ncbi:MAG: hypothetical protein R3362_00230, partial [Rhodothermales bacterium]|nr:hypothetical protein [Rhodothermales bacterium]
MKGSVTALLTGALLLTAGCSDPLLTPDPTAEPAPATGQAAHSSDDNVSPFDLIWDLDTGTTSAALYSTSDNVSPFDLIWDVAGGTTSQQIAPGVFDPIQ